MTRDDLESIIWRAFPNAIPAKVNTVLRAADAYAEDTAELAAARRAELAAAVYKQKRGDR